MMIVESMGLEKKLVHSPLFDHIREYLHKNDSGNDTTYIIVPYIKTAVMESLLEGIQNDVVIVTTWKPEDLVSGSSELDLYNFCQRSGYTLYINQNIHLKVYSIGLNDAILATCNVSHRGMFGGNHEAAVLVKLAANNRLYLECMRHEARLADDSIYQALKTWVEDNKQVEFKKNTLDDIVPKTTQDSFLISALPMTRRLTDLVEGYAEISSGHTPSNDPETAACIFHDLANYKINIGMDKKEFKSELSIKFFTHPFVKRIDEFISPDAYFGRIVSYVQSACTNVPVPSRRDLIGNVQVLLEWFVELGNEKYKVDIPYSHSQRIRKCVKGV